MEKKKKYLARTRIRLPDRPARTAVTIRTMLPPFRHKLYRISSEVEHPVVFQLIIMQDS